MRYRLRTLLIILALGPPMLAFLWFNPIAAKFLGAVLLYNLLAVLSLYMATFTANVLLRE
jgi:hypothetical protein